MATPTDAANTAVAASTAPLVQPQGLDHANLKVRDAEASLRFYTQVLGLSLQSVRRRDAEGRAEFVELRASQQRVFLARHSEYAPAERASRGLNHICIEIAPTPPERLLADLRARGVVVHREELSRRESDRGPTVSIYVEDLDGHGIELMQYVARR